MSSKVRTDSGLLERLDESLVEDFLTAAYSAEEISAAIRELGGDPATIGERGRSLIATIADSLAHVRMADSASTDSASEWIGFAYRNQNPLEEIMNKDFEFKQLLRAYRSGILSESAFETEMMSLENGAPGSNGARFSAFGKTYGSEREAVMKFLEAVAPAETAGGEAIRGWLEVCQLDCIKGGLKMVAEREAYHGRAFAQRLVELGGTVPQEVSQESRKNIDYLRNASIPDLEKLHKGATRFPNPDETIRPLFEFAEMLKEDQQTKEMVKLFAQDELSTLKWQNGLCAVLTEMKKKEQLAAAA